MKITYYLNSTRKKNLYCRISDGDERITFSLKQYINPEQWHELTGMPFDHENLDSYTDQLNELSEHLTGKYYEFKSVGKPNVLEQLKIEGLKIIEGYSQKKQGGLQAASEKIHDLKSSHPIKEYRKAFVKFSGVKENEFESRPVGANLIVRYKGKTYLVAHKDDLLNEHREYLANGTYEFIESHYPSELWEYLMGKILDWQLDKTLIDVYDEWKKYWNYRTDILMSKKEKEKISKDHLLELKESSFRDLQLLNETIRLHPENLIKNAGRISGFELLPIVVFAIKHAYKSEHSFFDNLTDFLIENANEYMDYDVFESVVVKSDSSGQNVTYYIYDTIIDY